MLCYVVVVCGWENADMIVRTDNVLLVLLRAMGLPRESSGRYLVSKYLRSEL